MIINNNMANEHIAEEIADEYYPKTYCKSLTSTDNMVRHAFLFGYKYRQNEIDELTEALKKSEANHLDKNIKLEKEVERLKQIFDESIKDIECLNKINNDLFTENVTANKKVDLLVTQLEKLLKAIENETR